MPNSNWLYCRTILFLAPPKFFHSDSNEGCLLGLTKTKLHYFLTVKGNVNFSLDHKQHVLLDGDSVDLSSRPTGSMFPFTL